MNTYIYHEKVAKQSAMSLSQLVFTAARDVVTGSRKEECSRKPKTSVLRTVAILQREPTREFTRVSIGSTFSASAGTDASVTAARS